MSSLDYQVGMKRACNRFSPLAMDVEGKTIFIAGPTGSGKSDIAAELAVMTGGEIVSADAYQVYRGMEILTASPLAGSGSDSGVPVHMVGIADPSENWNATLHYHKAQEIIEGIHARGRLAIVTGGSGLYLKFLTHGISAAPPSDEALRKGFACRELENLVEEFKQLDPEGASSTDLKNRRYVERNLEIVRAGGKPLSFWRSNWQSGPKGPGWVIDWDVAELDSRIAFRARRMVDEGVLEEVAGLGPCSPTADKALGLEEVRACLQGGITRDELIERLALITRQYAKRQRTWLKREQWLHKLPADSFCSFSALASQVKGCL